MSEPKHTAGRLKTTRLGSYEEPGHVILWLDLSKSGEHWRRLDYRGNFTEADARRLVACWNAFADAGITTDAIENGALLVAKNKTGMRSTPIGNPLGLLNEVPDPDADAVYFQQQRDRLLAALKEYGAHGANCLGGVSRDKRPCTCGLAAAIAAAEGQPK